MRLRIFKAFGLLLLGAVINVAVAWTCASVVSTSSWDADAKPPHYIHSDAIWTVPPNLLTFHAIISRDYASTDFGVKRQINVMQLMDNHCGFTTTFGERGVMTAGWPWQALKGEIAMSLHGTSRSTLLPAPFRKPLIRLNPRFGWWDLPLKPVPIGFIANTAVYATACGILFTAPWRFRQRIRRRRSLCPACAYPIWTSDVCTECGQKLRLSRK